MILKNSVHSVYQMCIKYKRCLGSVAGWDMAGRGDRRQGRTSWEHRVTHTDPGSRGGIGENRKSAFSLPSPFPALAMA